MEDRHTLMMREYDAWKQVVFELKLQKVDINECNSLARAIKEWGIAYEDLPTHRPVEGETRLEEVDKEKILDDIEEAFARAEEEGTVYIQKEAPRYTARKKGIK